MRSSVITHTMIRLLFIFTLIQIGHSTTWSVDPLQTIKLVCDGSAVESLHKLKFITPYLWMISCLAMKYGVVIYPLIPTKHRCLFVSNCVIGTSSNMYVMSAEYEFTEDQIADVVTYIQI